VILVIRRTDQGVHQQTLRIDQDVSIRHRQVEQRLAWRAWQERVFALNDDAPGPDLRRLSLPSRAHQLFGGAVFPIPMDLRMVEEMLAERGISVTCG
jgi:hypothetical protein